MAEHAKDWRDDIPLEWFPGILKEVAKVIGPRYAVILAESLGGLPLYLPKADEVNRKLRDRKIRAEFDGGNMDSLALKYDLTRRRIQDILKEQGYDDRQEGFKFIDETPP